MTALRFLPFLIILSFATLQIFAQQSVADLASKSDRDLFEDVYTASDLSTLEKEIKKKSVRKEDVTPKRIGLATMYLYEMNYLRRKAHLSYIYSLEGQQSYFYHNISMNGLEGLQSAFEGSEYELVMPEEFLDSDEKHEAFAITMENINGLSHPFLDQLKQWDLKPSGNEQPFLYTWIEEGTNGFVADEMAILAKELGLDALLTVQFSTVYQTQTISFYSIDLLLHGVNPAADEGQQGLVLGKYSISVNAPHPFVYIRNGKTSQEQFEPYNDLTARSTAYFLNYVGEQLAEVF